MVSRQRPVNFPLSLPLHAVPKREAQGWRATESPPTQYPGIVISLAGSARHAMR
jgi:hypothetical protein